MKNLFYNLAKSYINKYDAKKKEKDALKNEKKEKLFLKLAEAEQKFDKYIAEFTQKYIDEAVADFRLKINPKFKVGEIVTTNWYDNGTPWDGTMRMMQQHTPFRGPVDAEITGICLDCVEIEYIIDELKNRGELGGAVYDDRYDDYPYVFFKSIVDLHRNKYDVSWAYYIKIPIDDHEYWRYSIREHKLLKIDSDLANWSKKAYANQVESQKLYEEKKLLDEKIENELDKIRNELN